MNNSKANSLIDLNNSQHSIGIIGLGWLGLPLAQFFVDKQYSVIGSCTSVEKCQRVQHLGIDTCLLNLPVPSVTPEITRLFQQHTLVVAIPPGLRFGKNDYLAKLTNVVELAELGEVKHLILLNSTAIYGGLTGDVDEQSILDLSADKVAVLAEAEQIIQQFSRRNTVLRLGGLIGEDRHPGRFLTSGRAIPSGTDAINLVHQTDVISAIEFLIKAAKQNEIFNIVAPDHPSKREYYVKAATMLDLPAPDFDDVQALSVLSGKVVQSQKIQQLGFSFNIANLTDWLTSIKKP